MTRKVRTLPQSGTGRQKVGNLEDLGSLEETARTLKAERVGMRDVIIRDPAKFKVVVDETKGNKKVQGYGLDLNGTFAPFTEPGVESLCRWLKMDFEYFKKFPRKQEFIEHVATLMPAAAKENSGALVRLLKDGSVRGVVPGNYTVLDDEQVIQLMGAIAHQTLSKLKGVLVTSSGWDGSFYRMVFGESALGNRDEIYPSLTIRNSEIGGPLSASFGTLRILCMNGTVDATKVGRVLNWGHRGNFDAQVEKVGLALREAGTRIEPTMARIHDAVQKELKHPMEDLHRMLRAGWVTPQYHDAAEGVLAASLTQGTTFGAKTPRSKYAVFNALTEAAKVYRPGVRARWEAVAHNYLLLN